MDTILQQMAHTQLCFAHPSQSTRQKSFFLFIINVPLPLLLLPPHRLHKSMPKIHKRNTQFTG